MVYTIIENEKSYDLPQYNLKISAKMEAVEKFKTTAASASDKIRKMYGFITELVGKENAVEMIGKVDEADPNMINIVYLDIVRAYNKPLMDYEKERQAEQVNNEAFEKLEKLMSNLNVLQAMNKKSK